MSLLLSGWTRCRQAGLAITGRMVVVSQRSSIAVISASGRSSTRRTGSAHGLRSQARHEPGTGRRARRSTTNRSKRSATATSFSLRIAHWAWPRWIASRSAHGYATAFKRAENLNGREAGEFWLGRPGERGADRPLRRSRYGTWRFSVNSSTTSGASPGSASSEITPSSRAMNMASKLSAPLPTIR